MEGNLDFVWKAIWSLWGRPVRVGVEGHLEFVRKDTCVLCEWSLGVSEEGDLEFVYKHHSDYLNI